MARSGLIQHRKFRRLATLLKMPPAHVLGHLEMMWQTCYAVCDDFLGDELDVEAAAGWTGDPGEFVKAMLTCGTKGETGFLEEREPGVYHVHDLWENAPDYVQKRRRRELERRNKPVKGQAPTGQETDTDRTATGQQPDSDRETVAHVTSPHLTSPHLMSPHLTSPSGEETENDHGKSGGHDPQEEDPLQPLDLAVRHVLEVWSQQGRPKKTVRIRDEDYTIPQAGMKIGDLGPNDQDTTLKRMQKAIGLPMRGVRPPPPPRAPRAGKRGVQLHAGGG